MRILIAVLFACGKPPASKAPEPRPPPPAVDASIADAPADARVDAPADAAMQTVTIYERGKFTTMPVASASDHDGCIGTPEALEACKRVNPKMRCDLAPWFRASDVYCSGAVRRPELIKPRPAEACGCTCSNEYIKARDEWDRRSQACSNVP